MNTVAIDNNGCTEGRFEQTNFVKPSQVNTLTFYHLAYRNPPINIRAHFQKTFYARNSRNKLEFL